MSLLSRLFRPAGAARRPASVALHIDRLEDRTVPAVIDLTARGAVGAANGAVFAQFDAQPTGSGAIDSFLRIQGAAAKGATQQGYNTDARPLQFDENKSPTFTRSLKVADVPAVTIGGVVYREFLLDINQKASKPLLSLDQLRLFVGDSPKLRGYDGTAHALAGLAPVYDLDAGGDNWVKLDYRLNPGSGGGDMLFYVPEAALAGGGYVYLYSKFGEHFAANSGFQEWAKGANGVPVVPPPPAYPISGTVFADDNGNGTQDAGEAGLADRTVFLDTNGNGEYDLDEPTTITDGGGNYSFSGLETGPEFGYVVRVIQVGEEYVSEPLTIFLNPGDAVDYDVGVQGVD